MPALLLILSACLACAADGLRFDMNDPADVTTASNLDGFSVANGLASGQTRWDPYLYFNLPKDGLDVSALPYLTVRLYSSADADVLDVYYKCGDGLWGLGRTLPVKRGWAVYRFDLRKAGWTEPGMADAACQWGGVSKRIVSFRLDPGNQDGRWMALDSVELSAQPTGPDGLTQEPRGTLSAWLFRRMARSPRPGEIYREGDTEFQIRRVRRGKVFEVCVSRAGQLHS